MQSNTYVIEHLPQDDPLWRLVTFEYTHPDMPSVRSVHSLLEFDGFDELAKHVEDFTRVEGWNCTADDVPISHRHFMKLHTLQLHAQYVRDCIRAVADAEADLQARRDELAQALEDLANV